MTLPRFFLFAVLSVAANAAVARADREPQAAIRDEAGLFSPEALQKANERIAELRKTYQLNLVVETVVAPPEEVQKQLQAVKDTSQKEHCLNTWGEEKAQALGVDGVYVLICKEAIHGWFGKVYGYPIVIVQPGAQALGFGAHETRWLQYRLKAMSSRPDKEKDRDAKLLAALTQMREEVQVNLRPFPWATVGGLMAGALGVWGVLGLVRMRLQAAAPTAGPAEPRRLGLYNGLLGGMFGNVAGYWIYDTLFIASSASAASEAAAAPPTQAPPMDGAGEAVEPTPEQARADRMDLNAHEHAVEDEPSTGSPSQF